MNTLYMTYDLDLTEPRFKPGTVVRCVKDHHDWSGMIGIVNDEGIAAHGIGDWQDKKASLNPRYMEWEPVLPDTDFYPGDKVVCVDGSDVGFVGKVYRHDGGTPHLRARSPNVGDLTMAHGGRQWAILEPATTPLKKIREGDTVVCRKGSDAHVGQQGIVEASDIKGREGKLYAALQSGGTPYLDVAGRQWLVTKKAEQKHFLVCPGCDYSRWDTDPLATCPTCAAPGTLTREMFERLCKVEGFCKGGWENDPVPYLEHERRVIGRPNEQIRPALLGAIWDDCIEKPDFYLKDRPSYCSIEWGTGATRVRGYSQHPDRRTRIVLAYLEACGV